MKSKIAVLISGGLDSSILLSHLLKKGSKIVPIYVKSGHVWEKVEIYWLRRYLKKIAASNLDSLVFLSMETRDLYDGHWSLSGQGTPGVRANDRLVYLPGKNLLLITKAAVYCSLNKIKTLALGPLKTNPFPDARPSFFKRLERVCSEGLGTKFEIKTPFLKRRKREVMKLGRGLPLELTFSCLSPVGTHHCGCCNKCAERKIAFRKAAFPDLTPYKQ